MIRGLYGVLRVIGKLPPNLLRKYILNRIGCRDDAVVIGPALGEDSAVINLDDKHLIIHSDPITGAVEYLGWLAVHIASNDIAVSGARPRWLLPIYFFTEDTSIEFIDNITRQVDEAAKEVEAMIVGGHSEFTPGLPRPIISMTASGLVDKDKYISTGGAQAGDIVIMTKYAGLEGTAILASDFREILIKKGVSAGELDKSRELIKQISVVREALLLSDYQYVTSMHDPTEGGLIGGLTEIAYASNKSIVIYEDEVNVLPQTLKYSRLLNIDYLKFISSGVLIATVPPKYIDDAFKLLEKNNIVVSQIGHVESYKGYLLKLIRRDGGVEEYTDVYVTDEIMRLWGKGNSY